MMMMAKVSGKLIDGPGWQRNLVNQSDVTQQMQVTVHGVHADSGQLFAHSPVYFADRQTTAGLA